MNVDKWTVGNNGHNACMVYDSNGDGVCYVYGIPDHTMVKDVPQSFEEGMKTAQLIASTPELLDSLKVCVAALKVYEYGVSEITKAEAAIAKAEGHPFLISLMPLPHLGHHKGEPG